MPHLPTLSSFKKCAIFAGLSLSGFTTYAGFISNYQFIVREDLNANSRFHGSLLVGNDLRSDSVGEFGVDENGRFLFPASGDSLTVVNNVTAGEHRILKGNATVNGVLPPARLSANAAGATVTELGFKQDFSDLFQDYIDASNFVAGQTATGTTNFNGSNKTLALTGSGANIEYFDVDIASLTDLQNGLTFSNLSSTAEIFINVRGSELKFGTSALLPLANDPDLRSRVVWNFVDATKIDISGGRDFYGAILAPKAELTANQQIWGDLFVKNATVRNQIHATFFDGWTLTPIPEPSQVLLASTAVLIGLMLTRRTRSWRQIIR